MEKQEFKQKLIAIKNNKYQVPSGCDAYELAFNMLEYLGDIDDELRDDLIYAILSNWMISNVFTKEQQKQLLHTLLDHNHLFYKVGEQETDSVFMRAFSILLVAVLLYTHRQNSRYTKEELLEIKDKVITYMKAEKDVRGYIPVGGWAHTTAHSADTLDELALCEELGREELQEILQVIKEKISIGYDAYHCYEDERVAVAVNSLIGRNLLTDEEIAQWIESFSAIEKTKEYPNRYYLLSNIRNFLNSLYYRLPEGQYQAVKLAISTTILNIRAF